MSIEPQLQAQKVHRPMLTAAGQIDSMKDKGILFELIDERDSAQFLCQSNFFFKVKAFDKNFDKYQIPSSPKYGQYINLDFEYLVELSKLDMYFRSFILTASLDVEHFIKVRINNDLMRRDFDPYLIVENYLDQYKKKSIEKQCDNLSMEEFRANYSHAYSIACDLMEECNKPDFDDLRTIKLSHSLRESMQDLCKNENLSHIEASIKMMGDSTYSRRLVEKYGIRGEMAVWNFLEMISFGDLISFYKYYFLELLKTEPKEGEVQVARLVKRLLFPTKTLRNAAAHNDCLLNGMRESLHQPVGIIAKMLKDDYGLSPDLINATRKVPVVHDFSALLICHDLLVCSNGIREARLEELRKLNQRFNRHAKYFEKQAEIKNFFSYFEEVAQRSIPDNAHFDLPV